MRYFVGPKGRVKVVEGLEYIAYVVMLEGRDRWVIVWAEGEDTHVVLRPREHNIMIHCYPMGVQEELAMLTVLLLLATGEYFVFDKVEVYE